MPIRRILGGKGRNESTDEYRRRRFFRRVNAAYAALQADPAAWAEVMEERRVWEGTLMDGLEPEVWDDSHFV